MLVHCICTWVLGRFVYGIGYGMGHPSLRTPGALISHMGDWPLTWMAFKIAYNIASDAETVALAKQYITTLAKDAAGIEL